MSYPPVAEGIPVGDVAGGQAAPRVQRQTSEGFLRNLGMPPGINASFLRSNESFPLRIWIIDNSGSMATNVPMSYCLLYICAAAPLRCCNIECLHH